MEKKTTRAVLAVRAIFSTYALTAVLLSGVFSPGFGGTVFNLVGVSVLVVFIVSCFALQNILSRRFPRGLDLPFWLLGPVLLYTFLTGEAPFLSRAYWVFAGAVYILLLPGGFLVGISASAPLAALRSRSPAVAERLRFGLDWVGARRLAGYGLCLAVAVFAAAAWAAGRLEAAIPAEAPGWRVVLAWMALGTGTLGVVALTVRNTTLWGVSRTPEA